MSILEGSIQEVMLVCRNGHVITDLLRTYPEQAVPHCDRCGALTLDRCPTCGLELSVGRDPGLVTVGERRPPAYCSACGGAFPWSRASASPRAGERADLEVLLRRLPRVARQLRNRQGNRPPFRVDDVHDLEDLLRSLLPICCDPVYPETRTPTYATGTRTDFLLPAESAVVVVKLAGRGTGERQLAEQREEDVRYYQRRGGCRTLFWSVHDAEGRLADPWRLERVWSGLEDDLVVRCVIAS